MIYNRKYRHSFIFFWSVHIWHQLYPETVVPCSTTSKSYPKYALPFIPPLTIIWPIPHSTVVWLWNLSNWIPRNLCGWKFKTHRLTVLVNPRQSMMVYWTHSWELPPPHCIYKQNKGRTSDQCSSFFTKIHNAMYVTWICKNMCRTLCSTTVTNQILPAL